MKAISRRWAFALVASIIILVCYVLPFLNILIPATCVLLASLLLKPLLARVWDRIALSIALLMCLNILLGALFWAFGLTFDTVSLITLHTAVSLLLSLVVAHTYEHSGSLKTKPHFDISTRTVMFSIGIFLVVFAPLAARLDTNYIYQFVLFGGDNVTHLELTRAITENNGFLYANEYELKDKIVANNIGYPQGLHINIYAAEQYLGKLVNIDTPKRSLIIFMALTSVLYAMFCYIWTRNSQRLLSLLKTNGKHRGWFEGLTYVINGIAFLGTFLHFYTNGFQPHILSLIFFGLILYLAISSINLSANKKLVYYLLIFVLNIGISFTWLFLAPVSLLVSGLIVLNHFKDQLLTPRAFGTMIKNNFAFFITLMLLICASFIQVFIQMKFGLKEDPINESGYIFPLTQTLVLASAAVPFVLYLLYRKEKARPEGISVFVLFVLISFLFSLLIYIYQISSIGRTEYYYHKSTYHILLLAVIALPLLANMLFVYIDRTGKRLLVALMLFFIVASAHLSTPTQLVPLINGQVASISPDLTNAYADRINTVPSDLNNVIAIGSCNRQQDYQITRLSGILGDDNTYSRQNIAFDTINDASSRAAWIEKYQTVLESRGEKLLLIDSGTRPFFLGNETLDTAEILSVNTPEQKECPHKYSGLIKPEKTDKIKPF